jgi:hypothetical protein
MSHPAPTPAPAGLEPLLGQIRAFAAVGGRCSAAHAQVLRTIREEKLYLPIAASWREFCPAHLRLSRRHADRIIATLKRFGPAYFELCHYVGISARDYASIAPNIRSDALFVDGHSISLIPSNAPGLVEAVDRLLARRRPARPASTRASRIARLAARCRDLAARLVSLYDKAASMTERELILEAVSEIRVLLLEVGID